jgi:hypothetical protein
VDAVHVGDQTTSLRLNATVRAGDGGDCTDCEFEWTENDVVIGHDLPQSLALDVAQPGAHTFTLKVVDREPASPATARASVREFTVSALPQLSLVLVNPEATWGGPDVGNFVYRLPVRAILRVQQVGVQNRGQIELTDLDGLRLPQGTTLIELDTLPADLFPREERAFDDLILQGTYEWDRGDCQTPRASLQTWCAASFDVQASGLTDVNGFALPRLCSVAPRLAT